MSPQLRAMLVSAGVALLAGVGVVLYTPQPATRSMADLKDAGILDAAGQKLVLTCPERLTTRTAKRIEKDQPGLLRPSQAYAHIARVAVGWNPDGGNCFKPSDMSALVSDLECSLVIPGLRRDAVGLDDAGIDDGGEDTVDDSNQFRLDSCSVVKCSTYDAGDGSNFCGKLNRLQMVASPCMLPNGWGRAADGGWCEESCGGPVDCRFGGPYAEADGGPRWRGFNVGPTEYAVGSACVPVECSVIGGENPIDFL